LGEDAGGKNGCRESKDKGFSAGWEDAHGVVTSI
jgi:hypothetical protein